ncbi:hypothetical protein ACWATR_34035 [Nostoc sp. UIC 10890]
MRIANCELRIGLTPWANQIRNQITQVRLSHEDRSYQPGIREVASGVPIGVAKGIKGNYDARRAYGLSCSPRQAAMAQAPTVGDRLETD